MSYLHVKGGELGSKAYGGEGTVTGGVPPTGVVGVTVTGGVPPTGVVGVETGGEQEPLPPPPVEGEGVGLECPPLGGFPQLEGVPPLDGVPPEDGEPPEPPPELCGGLPPPEAATTKLPLALEYFMRGENMLFQKQKEHNHLCSFLFFNLLFFICFLVDHYHQVIP